MSRDDEEERSDQRREDQVAVQGQRLRRVGDQVVPTNNPIESWNTRIRDMPRRHRGLSLVRQIKALYREAWEHSQLGAWQTTGTPKRYGTGIDWHEFHTPTEHHGAPTDPPPDTQFGL